jgi:putative tryptophan/tyrosine transport system substrate-binding protein
VLTATTESELEADFATMVQNRVGALVLTPDRRGQLVELTARYTTPAIYLSRIFAEFGRLMSYGSSYVDLYESSGIYVGRIPKGAKPADLPIQQSTKGA